MRCKAFQDDGGVSKARARSVAWASTEARAWLYPAPPWKTDGIVALSIEAAEKGAAYGYPIVSPSIAKRIRFAVEIVRKAGSREEAMAELYDWFGGGDGAADSIPSAIALFVLGNGSVRDTVEAAANLGGDCDTNGAIAGAIAGAMAGVDGVPAEWKKTICSVNHISMEQYAQMIEDAAGSWKTAGENT